MGMPHAGDRGSIPAWAGETADSLPAVFPQWVYPRVGGGNDCYHIQT